MMKRKLLFFSTLLAVILVLATSFSVKKTVKKSERTALLSKYRVKTSDFVYNVPTEEELIPFKVQPQYQLFLGKTYLGFKEALGFKESRGSYATVNEFGYLGKYQFAASTLRMIGIHNSDTFMEDTRLQEAAFNAYTSRNKWILRKDIKRFNGKYINGIKVTESGILAAAHLAGAGNVKKYLRSGGAIGFSDAFGTSIGYYLKKFGGYDTSFILPNKQAKAKML